MYVFFFDDTATTEIYTLSLHDALPILLEAPLGGAGIDRVADGAAAETERVGDRRGLRAERILLVLQHEKDRSEEHTSELQSPDHLVCRLLLEKKKKDTHRHEPCSQEIQ